MVYWNPYDFASLPRWVHRVDSCPDPNNISHWLEASHKLNCYHNLTSTDPQKQAVVYHCLPSSFLNETVEFCGKNVPIVPGTFFTIAPLLIKIRGKKLYISLNV